MAKYIFVNLPGSGHVNPTLAVVQELVARGEEVVYYLTEEFRATIEATGATFRPYTHPGLGGNVAQAADAMQKGSMPLPVAQVFAIPQIIDELLEPMRAEYADVLVYDFMCIWGKIVAQLLHLPAVLLRPSYARLPDNMGALFAKMDGFGPMGAAPGGPPAGGPSAGGNPMLRFFGEADKQLTVICQQYNLPPMSMRDVFFNNAEPLTIAFIPRLFQPGGEQLDERFVFVGPSINTRPDTTGFPVEQLEGKTVLYISLGTAFNNQVAFYNTCIAAFKDSPFQVVLAYGKRIDPSALDPIPDNFLARPHVPQLEVLAHTSVFLSHGGMNSTMESLYYGVPLVEFPQMVEQMMTAQRVQEMGLGKVLASENLSAETLRGTVESVLADNEIRTHVQEVQQQIRQSGGYRAAADALINYSGTLV